MVEHWQATAGKGDGEMSVINLSPETQEELKLYIDGDDPEIPYEYLRFALAWSTFNRVYNENRIERFETQQVINIGDQLEGIWDAVAGLARELVSIECIGGEKDPSGILRPKPEVKSATLFLRNHFHLDESIPGEDCHFAECRPEKRLVCNPVQAQPWSHSRMAALLRLVYQVRCNLVHGDKRLMVQGYQRDRDQQLVHLSNEILKIILREIGTPARETI